MTASERLLRSSLLAVLVSVFAFALVPGKAAASPAPAWTVGVFAVPGIFAAAENGRCIGGATTFLEASQTCDAFAATATNVGGKAGNGGTVTLRETLPTGLAVQFVSLVWSAHRSEELAGGPSESGALHFCSVSLSTVTCTIPHTYFESVSGEKAIAPDDSLELFVFVTVNEPEPAPETPRSTVLVEGGGAAKAEGSGDSLIGGSALSFGLSGFSAPMLGSSGGPDEQAASHPYEQSVELHWNTVFRGDPEGILRPTSVQDLRDVVVDLPLGLAGSAVATPTCTLTQLTSKGSTVESGVSGCPQDTIVGHIQTGPEGFVSANSPLYNLVPERGVAAEFGFIDLVGDPHVIYVTLAPTREGYVLRSETREVPQIVLSDASVNIYGDPAARDGSGETPVPMLTNPADCSGEPLKTVLYMDSWQSPGAHDANGRPEVTGPGWVTNTYESPPVTGCSELAGSFNPEIEAKPESSQTDSPTGLQVNLKVPQNEGMEGRGSPPVKATVVTLPEGITVNPSQANGLQACSEAQVGWLGKSPDPSGEYENFTAAPPACPEASKIGSVELETPALPSEGCKQPGKTLRECAKEEPAGSGVFPEREKTPILGSIYVAPQLENPFGSLLAIYIVVDDPRTGVIVKIPGEVKANETTGQLTTVVPDTPQFPFSELRTHFFGGATASLRTPATCGTYTLTSELTPWSSPESGPPATPSSSFEITQGAGGGSCAHAPGEEPNTPTFQAGTLTPTAGSFSPLVVHLSREDGSQEIAQINVTLPPGATGKIAGIPQCSQPQIAQAISRSHPGEGALEAADPSCPDSSKIGTVTVGAGAGPKPFYVTGNAYLAGPYKGAPFSGVFITPAIAGPFDLGVVVVRAGLYINATTAQVTTKSDPLPRILDGIPLDVRSIAVDVNRPQFTLNPTNCTPMTVTGEEISTQGQVAPLSNRFQVGSCESLPFKPVLTASAVGKGSKADGTTFKVDVTSAGLGVANIAKVDLTLPKALPSRLSTIQKACVAAVFDANPASCDEGSVIGSAAIRTPLLANPLSGPAYLVSHGGAAFPDVEFVLQGENITLILDGRTDIKKGVTYSKFESTPDAPFTTFETTFPAGPHSALTPAVPERENFSLCKTPLSMPTEITGQNGKLIKKTTNIPTTGCPPALTITRTAVKGDALRITVRLGQAGTVKITGKGLRTTTKKGLKAGTRTITVPLTATGRAAKRHRTKLKLEISETVSGLTGTATATLKA